MSSPPCYTPDETIFAINSLHRLGRFASGSSAVVLEGKHDGYFWSNKIHKKCELFPIEAYSSSNNKEDVREIIRDCLNNLEKRKISFGLLGIVDEDYDWSEDEEDSNIPAHLISTAPNTDLENVLFHTDRIGEWLSQKTDVNSNEIHASSLEISKKIGILRALCAERQRNAEDEKNKKQYRLNFRFNEDEDWYIPIVHSLGSNTNSMIQLVLSNTTHSNKPPIEDLKSRYTKAEKKYCEKGGHNSQSLARGHDIARVISQLIDSENISPRSIERWIRNNVSLSDISDSEIVKKIRNWEQSNKPYKILIEN